MKDSRVLTVLTALFLGAACSAHGGHGSPGSDGGITTSPASCAVVLCPVGTTCTEVDGEAMCLEENPCNLVDCMPGAVCEVVDGEAVCTPSQGGNAPMCGGIAAFECPGAGVCVDDASDDCDPENGGADCSGICTCDDGVLVLCAPGTIFDANPNVCSCVALAGDAG